MLDNGYPLTTEPNALRDIIMPPSLFKKILAVAGTAGSVIGVQPYPPLTVSTRRMAKATPTPFSSPIPWRATGLRYNRNEIFFDIVEEMQGIMGRYVPTRCLRLLQLILQRDGKALSVEIWGKIKANTRLTGISFVVWQPGSSITLGTPDIFLNFSNPQILTDCSFHPCVRYELVYPYRRVLNVYRLPKWTKDKMLSFVPPDGRFMLMEYRLGTSGTAVASIATIPFSMKSSVELLDNSANVDLIFQPGPGSSKGLQSVLIEWYLGKGVTTSSWIPAGGGTYTFETRTGVS
jgi:AP-3 complex subunit mu